MEKKTIIILIAIAVVVIVGVLLYMHYTPVWVSVTNVIVGAVSVVVGWFAHVLYGKYIKK